MSIQGGERPLCLVTPRQAREYDTFIFVNENGRNALISALQSLPKDGKPVRFPVFENGSWCWIEVHFSSQADFDYGQDPCECGCQKEFAEIEAKYREGSQVQ